jgi:hypothetical protein
MLHSQSPEPAMLARYDRPGPRYTSYPTTPHFRSDFGPADFEAFAARKDRAMVRSVRVATLLAIMAALAACRAPPVATQAPQTAQIAFDATVEMSGTTVAAGVGYGWGHGTITYHGEEHAFCVHGVAVGDVGVARIHAEGLVFNLEHLHDFPGRYYAGSMGVAVVGGESNVVLKNQDGVTMQLETREQGLRFNIAASGLRIELAPDGKCGK